MLTAMLASAQLSAGDLNKGYTFTPGEQNVTHTKLNNLVDAGTINTTFFTDKSAVTTLNTSDLFLLYSPTLTGYRKVALQNLLLANTALITSQTEDSTPSDDDFVLTYDTSGTGFKKVSLVNLALANTNLIYLLPTLSSNLLESSFVPLLQDGTNNKTPISLILDHWQSHPFTNLSAIASQTNSDRLLIWDSAAGTNKWISIAAWNTNPPAASAFTNDDSFLFWSTSTNAADGTNGRLKRLTMAGVYTNPPTATAWTNTDTVAIWSTATNGPGGTNPTPAKIELGTILPRKFVSAEYPLPTTDGGGTTNIAHGLPGEPQVVNWVLVCKTSNAGYDVGDAIPINRFYDSGGSLPSMVGGGNATNVFLTFNRRSGVGNKSGANTYTAPITEASWRARCTAFYFP
jgi:hypothetical protein